MAIHRYTKYDDPADIPAEYWDAMEEERMERLRTCRCRSTSIDPCDYCSGDYDEEEEEEE